MSLMLPWDRCMPFLYEHPSLIHLWVLGTFCKKWRIGSIPHDDTRSIAQLDLKHTSSAQQCPCAIGRLYSSDMPFVTRDTARVHRGCKSCCTILKRFKIMMYQIDGALGFLSRENSFSKHANIRTIRDPVYRSIPLPGKAVLAYQPISLSAHVYGNAGTASAVIV